MYKHNPDFGYTEKVGPKPNEVHNYEIYRNVLSTFDNEIPKRTDIHDHVRFEWELRFIRRQELLL